MLKRIVLMLALLCAALPAFAQVGAITGTATDPSGRRISKPQVKVCADSACASTSTIYADANKTPLVQPFTGDTQGNYTAFAGAGTYYVQISKAGYSTYVVPVTVGGDVASGGNNTLTGTNTFTGNLYDDTSSVLRPGEFAGADLCARISAAYAWAITQGWTSVTVDARQRRWQGQQNCAASPFAGVSNNGTFTGVLLTQGTQFVMSAPIVVPGGMRWDGHGPRSLTDPRNDAGTSVQPSSTYATNYPLATNPIVQYGLTADTSSPQKIWLTNMAVGCLAPGASYVASTGSTGIYNGNGQEGSGGEFLDIVGCQYGISVDVASGAGAHSGFDSAGFHHIAITVPNDAAAGGILFGNTAQGTGLAIADVFGFEDITVTGAPSGTQAGFCADIEGSATYLKGIRCYYTAKGIIVGNTLTAVAVSIDTVDTEGNVSYPTQTIVELDSHAGYLINVANIRAGGTTTNILTDANYPGGACTLLQSNEAGISLYSRGIGGGANGVVVSTSRTACTSKNLVPNVALLNAGQTFSAGTQVFGAENGTTVPLKIAAANTATGANNYGSNVFSMCMNYWNGTVAADVCPQLNVASGAGATPSLNMYIQPPSSPPGGTALNLGGSSTALLWGAVNVGNSGGSPTPLSVYGALNVFNSAATFKATIAQPTLTANRTITWPDGNSSTVMVASLSTAAATTDTVTVTGMTSSGHCQLTPTNATAATNITTTYVSAKAANQITVTHTATSGMTYDVMCTSN